MQHGWRWSVGIRPLVMLVVRESEDMEEMEEDGVWVLCEGGGVENAPTPIADERLWRFPGLPG